MCRQRPCDGALLVIRDDITWQTGVIATANIPEAVELDNSSWGQHLHWHFYVIKKKQIFCVWLFYLFSPNEQPLMNFNNPDEINNDQDMEFEACLLLRIAKLDHKYPRTTSQSWCSAAITVFLVVFPGDFQIMSSPLRSRPDYVTR